MKCRTGESQCGSLGLIAMRVLYDEPFEEPFELSRQVVRVVEELAIIRAWR